MRVGSIVQRFAWTCLVVVSSFAIPQLAATEPQTPPSRDREYGQIDAMIRRVHAESPDTALSIGVVEGGHLAWVKNYGIADATTERPPASSTIYPIASVTKVLTGVMLLQLADRGVVHLADPVERYVPEIRHIPNPYPWAPPITLIQLATMTTGIRAARWPSPPGFPSRDTDPASWDQRLVALLPLSAYGFEPGTRREYSNVGYGILGLALSRAAHRSYTEYITTEILQPLGMRDSSFSIGAGARSRLAYGSKEMPRMPSWEQSPVLPAAGLFTTLDDLVKLMRFQLGLGPEGVLSHKALQDSLGLVVPSDADLRYGDGVGFSASRNPESNFVALGHGGRTWHYVASYEFDRVTQSGIIVLTGHVTDEYKPVVREALKMMHPDSAGGTALLPLEKH